MSRYTDQLSRTRTLIDQVLKGAEKNRALVDLAAARAEAWCELPRVSTETRGGSSSPEAIEERQERERVQRMATEAALKLPAEITFLEQCARTIFDRVQRLAAVVDPAKYDKPVEPGCVSCARTEKEGKSDIGGHWTPPMPAADVPNGPRGNAEAAEVGLCRWCADYARVIVDASGDEELTIADPATWPPVKACDLYHSQSPRAAGIWLAQSEAKKAPSAA